MSNDYKIIMQLETLAGQMDRPDTQGNHHTRDEGKHSHPDGQLDSIWTDSHDVQWIYEVREWKQAATARGKEISRLQSLPLPSHQHEKNTKIRL
jgi:hypothetical protein